MMGLDEEIYGLRILEVDVTMIWGDDLMRGPESLHRGSQAAGAPKKKDVHGAIMPTLPDLAKAVDACYSPCRL